MVQRRVGEDNVNDKIKAVKTGGFLGFGKDFESWEIKGLSGNDSLTGATKKDTLDGGSGIDTLIGGKSDDLYFVDNPNDVIIEKSGSDVEGIDLVLSKAAKYVLPNNVENLTIEATNFFAVEGIGNSRSNIINGASSNDFLSGLGSNDTINGFAGNDTLVGGDGRDSLFAGVGDDSLRGGTLSDYLEGSNGNDTLQGGETFGISRVDEFDTLSGGEGEDLFVLGIGNKSLYTSRGNRDFGTIKDFNSATDRLQVAGTRSEYSIQGSSLFYQNDLIAVFEGLNQFQIGAILDSNTDFGE